MSYTNHTPNYELPQYIATDKPTYLVDANGAYLAIDTAMKANATATATAQSTADANTANITTLSGQVTTIDSKATNAEQLATTAAGGVNTINSLIGNGEPTTTDKTLIGAINELNAGKASASDVTAISSKVGTATLDTTAQDLSGAVNEINAKISSSNMTGATDISAYDTEQNKFTCPNDGYVIAVSGTATTGYMDFVIYSANDVGIADVFLDITRQYQAIPVYVKKGMKTYLKHTETGCVFRFYEFNV